MAEENTNKSNSKTKLIQLKNAKKKHVQTQNLNQQPLIHEFIKTAHMSRLRVVMTVHNFSIQHSTEQF